MNVFRAMVTAAAVGGVAGCAADPAEGWSTATAYRPDVSSIAVQILESDAYERGIEFELADALVKEIHARTPYRVTSAGRADTILTGRIRRVDRRQLSKSPLTGLSEEVTLSVTIDLTWKDLRTGESLLELNSFTAQGLFVPSRPTSEPIEIGEFGAVQRMAHDIVSEMRGDW